MTIKRAKLALICWRFRLRTKTDIIVFGVDGTQCFAKKRIVIRKAKNNHHFEESFPPITNKHTRTWTKKRQKSFPLWRDRVDSTLVDTVNRKFTSIFNLNPSSLQWSNNIFSVSNNTNEWSLDFGPDSFTLTVKELVQKTTKIFHGVHMAAWSLMVSNRHDILCNHIARLPIIPHREGTMEMRDDVLKV